MPIVTVVGSTNTDLVIKTPRLPNAGETVKGTGFQFFPGGKGANQAVAAARLGAEVNFITKIGRDDFGNQALANFKHEGIKTDYILVDENNSSGVALIEVDQTGQNRIVISPGANGNLTVDDIKPIKHVIENSDVLLLQLEIPLETVGYVMEIGASAGAIVILNPAPAEKIPIKFYQHISIVTPNQTEATLLTGLESGQYDEIADWLRQKGVNTAIITLGQKGAYYKSTTDRREVPGFQVKAIDTTAAGDAFNAGLAVAIGEGCLLRDAICFANAAGALAVTKMGAQPSMPKRSDVENFLKKNYILIHQA
jgi:ribokinase